MCRLVRDKEGVRRRLEEEERDFLERRKEYVRSIIQFERQVRAFDMEVPIVLVDTGLFTCARHKAFDMY